MSLFQRTEEITDRLGLADCRTREAHAECPFDPQKELRPPQAIDAEIPLQTARCGDVDDLRPLRVQLAHELAYDSNEFLLARSTITQRDNRAPLIRPCLHKSMMLTHSADTTLIRIKVLPIPPTAPPGRRSAIGDKRNKTYQCAHCRAPACRAGRPRCSSSPRPIHCRGAIRTS